MRWAGIFALVALSPAATNAAAWTSPALILALCSGDGSPRLIAMTGPQPTAPRDEREHCPKGCHAGASRKREFRPIRP